MFAKIAFLSVGRYFWPSGGPSCGHVRSMCGPLWIITDLVSTSRVHTVLLPDRSTVCKVASFQTGSSFTPVSLSVALNVA